MVTIDFSFDASSAVQYVCMSNSVTELLKDFRGYFLIFRRSIFRHGSSLLLIRDISPSGSSSQPTC